MSEKFSWDDKCPHCRKSLRAVSTGEQLADEVVSLSESDDASVLLKMPGKDTQKMRIVTAGSNEAKWLVPALKSFLSKIIDDVIDMIEQNAPGYDD